MGHGRRSGPPCSPFAFIPVHIATYTSVVSGDNTICKFWEIEESPNSELTLSLDEHAVVHHFKVNHRRNNEGRFIVPLLKRPDSKPIGESRSQATKDLSFLSVHFDQKSV